MPSVEITPGYDFGLTEIPTKNKFLQAALGIDIGKIQFEDVDVSLVASYGGEVSGSTGASLPGEGYLWTDPAGNTWIETVDGPVRLNRNDGGWESMRWHNNTRLVGQDDARGFGVELEGAGGSENSMRFEHCFVRPRAHRRQGHRRDVRRLRVRHGLQLLEAPLRKQCARRGKEWYHGMLLGPDSGTSHWSDGASGVEVGEAYMLCYFYGSDTPLKV
jgi:hypothetical protein